MAGTRQPDSVVRDRRERTLAVIREHGEIRIEHLAAEFGVSPMTTRRDVEWLVSRGLVRQSRGWVSSAPSVLVEIAANYRMQARVSVKAELAARASRELSQGLTIMVDDSTSCLPLVRSLGAVTPVTLVTNFLAAGREAGAIEGVDVILVGGPYRGDLDACLGSDVSERLRGMHADLALLSTPALADGTLYHPINESAAVKRAMLSASSRHILIADATKYGRTAPFAFGEAEDFDLLVTESAVPGAELEAFTNAGVRVETVETAGSRLGSTGHGRGR